MRSKAFRAVALAAALVGWSATSGLALPGRRHPMLQAGLAAGLVVLGRVPVGLRPPPLRSGMRTGLTAATAIVVGVGLATALPQVRAATAARDVPASTATWLAVGIPLGTVWPEEAAYRAALGTAAADAFGARLGRLLQAAAFGLSHIYDARATGQPIAPTVLATGVAGWLFARLFESTGSLAAPMLAHLAINEAGAVAALAVRGPLLRGRLSTACCAGCPRCSTRRVAPGSNPA